MTESKGQLIESHPQFKNGVLATATDTKVIVGRMRAIREVMNTVMKEGTHYGKIPGCDQPSLYKSGSECLLAAFQIAVKPEVVEDRHGDHISYKVTVIGVHQATGVIVGAGVGECSTAEDKYAWRSAVCDEEFDETPETHRRVKWNKGKYNQTTRSREDAWSVKQVRTNPGDLANTCLKMAKKRAQIDLCLTSLGASDIFTQDLEDLPAEYIEGDDSSGQQRQQKSAPPNKYQPKERGQGGGGNGGGNGKATEKQVGLLRTKIGRTNGSISEDQIVAHFGITKLEEIAFGSVNDAIAILEGKAQLNDAGKAAGAPANA